MKYIETVNGIKSSVIGFGCAPILGSRSASQAKQALDIALENGVTHLDIARSYGYGEAESFIGNYLKGKRHQVVIASKFGIKANWKASLLKPLKPIIRSLKKGSKGQVVVQNQSTPINSVADRFHDRIQINRKNMQMSFDESLKALKTDYLDYYFIHEPPNTIVEIAEVLEFANQLKSAGKIRAFGMAFMRNQELLHSQYLNEFDILQFNLSPVAEDYKDVVKNKATVSNIFFSPMSGGNTELTAKEKLLKLHNDFPKSIILCSMFSKQHIIDNCNLFPSS